MCRVCGADNAPDAEHVKPVDWIEFDDSLQLDVLGEWSHIKHEIVSKYAPAYTTILKSQPLIRRFVYADGFAGSGVALARDTDALVRGSAMLALDVHPPFSEYHFIERDDVKRDFLKQLMAKHPNVTVHEGDCNRVLVDRVLPRCRYEDFARGLCLLDPYGLSVDYSMLKAVAATRTVEIFLNFMLVGANRNVLWTKPDRVSAKRRELLTRVWGDESWRTDLYETQPDLFGSIERKRSNQHVVAKYLERLRAAGFEFVPEPIPMFNSRGNAIYYLFFASPNKTGARIVEEIFSKYRR